MLLDLLHKHSFTTLIFSTQCKVVCTSIVFIFVLNPLFFTPRAHAIFGVADVSLTIDASPAPSARDLILSAAQFSAKVALESFKRRALREITDQIVDWIDGGGKPRFITDWKGFFEDIGKQTVGDLAFELGAAELCSPFGLHIQFALQRPPRFSSQVRCTLDTIVGNIQNFYDDFRNGGWIAFSESWRPQNNFYGSVLLAMQEKNKRIAAEDRAYERELMANNGFLGVRNCQSGGGRVFCTITTPGAEIGAAVAKAVGSDIDYIVNSQELAAFVAAISDAFINRLIRSGVEGFLGLPIQDNTGRGQSGVGFTGSADPCGGLIGPALTACRQTSSVELSGIGYVKGEYLRQIDLVFLPLSQGLSSLQESVRSQTSIVDGLSALQDCRVSRGLPPHELQNTLPAEITLLQELEEEESTQENILGRIDFARRTIVNVNAVSGSKIAADAFYSISNDLDPVAASLYKQTKLTQALTIRNKLLQIQPTIQTELNQCRAGF